MDAHGGIVVEFIGALATNKWRASQAFQRNLATLRVASKKLSLSLSLSLSSLSELSKKGVGGFSSSPSQRASFSKDAHSLRHSASQATRSCASMAPRWSMTAMPPSR